jgi:poly-beta-1,6-N-acetyl-D-glucosamine synthase
MLLISIVSTLFALGYWILMRFYAYQWCKISETSLPFDFTPETTIEIIIPSRNEASNIEKCLASLQSLDYPETLFHITLIDDFSTDNTFEIIQRYASENISILQMKDFVANTALSNKKTAIATAINTTQAQLIVTTDADCNFSPKWLQYFAYKYEVDNCKIIAAPVLFTTKGSVFEDFQALDYCGMMGITGAGIHSKHMYMCNGANLAYDRKTYLEVGGFENIDNIASGDDMLLMQKIAQKHSNKIGFIKSKNATVFSNPMGTYASFLNQRLRWASKSGHYKQWWIDAELILVWLFCTMIIVLQILAPFSFQYCILFFVLLSTKIIADYPLLKATSSYFGQKSLLKIFFIAQFYHIVYIVMIGWMKLLGQKAIWKGR